MLVMAWILAGALAAIGIARERLRMQQERRLRLRIEALECVLSLERVRPTPVDGMLGPETLARGREE